MAAHNVAACRPGPTKHPAPCSPASRLFISPLKDLFRYRAPRALLTSFQTLIPRSNFEHTSKAQEGTGAGPHVAGILANFLQSMYQQQVTQADGLLSSRQPPGLAPWLVHRAGVAFTQSRQCQGPVAEMGGVGAMSWRSGACRVGPGGGYGRGPTGSGPGPAGSC